MLRWVGTYVNLSRSFSPNIGNIEPIKRSTGIHIEPTSYCICQYFYAPSTHFYYHRFHLINVKYLLLISVHQLTTAICAEL